jgi:hypothetical protein
VVQWWHGVSRVRQKMAGWVAGVGGGVCVWEGTYREKFAWGLWHEACSAPVSACHVVLACLRSVNAL